MGLKKVGVQVVAEGSKDFDKDLQKNSSSTDKFKKDLNELVKKQNQLINSLQKKNKTLKESSKSFNETTNKANKFNGALSELGVSSALTKLSIAALSGVAIRFGYNFGKSVISASKELDTFQVQFTTILKSSEAAQKRMAELSLFAATTPFQLEQVAGASRVLENFTKGVLSTGDGLRLVGDAAAAVNTDFEGLALWVGRAYDGLQSNRPVGEAMMRLQELALVTGDARNKIEQLQQAGRGKEAWTVLKGELERNKGGMEALSKTGAGLESTFRDLYKEVLRELGKGGAYDLYKSSLLGINETMKQMIEDGDFETTGNMFANFAEKVAKYWRFLVPDTTELEKSIKNLKQELHGFDTLKEGLGEKTLLRKENESPKTDISIKSKEEIEAEKQLKSELIKMNEEYRLVIREGKYKELEQEKINFENRLKEIGQNQKAIQLAHAIHRETIEAINEKYDNQEKEKTALRNDESNNILIEQQINKDKLFQEEREKAQNLREQIFQESLNFNMLSEEQELAQLEYKYREQEKMLLEHFDTTFNLTEINEKKISDVKKKYKDIEDKRTDEKIEMARGFFGAISGLTSALIKDQKKAAVAQKVLSIFSITADTAVAIMKAYRSGDPYSATAKAIVIGAIGAAQIATVAATPYQNGGIDKAANGNIYRGSEVGDRNIAALNGGEMINNKRQQSNIMNAYGLSGGVTAVNQQKLFNLIESGSGGKTQGTTYNFTINLSGGAKEISLSDQRRLKEQIRLLVHEGQL